MIGVGAEREKNHLTGATEGRRRKLKSNESVIGNPGAEKKRNNDVRTV